MRTGRPRDKEVKATVDTIHVSLDEESKQALVKIEATLPADIRRGRTSVAVRRALRETAARLR